MKSYMYLAYGSNLHFGQMKSRCPDSYYLGRGFLKGAELEFRGYPGSCFCTVDLNKPSKKVPVGIFMVSERDLIYLNRYEGYPSHYRIETIKPDRLTIKYWQYPDIALTDCFIYIMNRGELGSPSQHYYDVVEYGYDCCGMDKKFLEEAYNKSVRAYNRKHRV